MPLYFPGDIPDPGVEPMSPALWVDSVQLSHQGSHPKGMGSKQESYHIYDVKTGRNEGRNRQAHNYSWVLQHFSPNA